MRETKYRIWNKITKEIAEIDVIDFKEKYVIVSEDFIWNADPITHEGECQVYFKDLELIQFTGLHDKNGKEIYEGDVVTCKFAFGDNICEIVYESACFWVSQKNRGIKDIAHDNLYWHIEGIEVIGNVWENPELLEDKATV